mgnify:CR=1 FL=1
MLPQLQTGAVAGGKQPAIPVGYPAVNDWPDCMQHIAAGKVEGGGDLGLTGWLRTSLLLHNFGAGQPQLDPGIGMDGVVDTAVIWNVAAGETGVCRIDNGITAERCDISLPGDRGRGCKGVRSAASVMVLAEAPLAGMRPAIAESRFRWASGHEGS